MTRYTNLGRKRTHLEAGFDNEETIPDRGIDLEEEAKLQAEVSDRPEKKQKRSKGKAKGPDGGDDGAPRPSRNEEGNVQADSESVGRSTSKKAKKAPWKDAATRSETRRVKRIQQKHADTVCFACREKGHPANNCPNVKPEGEDMKKGKPIVGICYQCGSTKHTLSRCKKPKDPLNPLPFASCFVCSGKGHLASSCPKNKSKGVYPNGGCCKLCEETTHLARDCPLRKQPLNTVVFAGTGREAGADEDDFHTIKRKAVQVDREERTESRAINKLDIKVGAMSKTIKSFVTAPATTKKIVFF